MFSLICIITLLTAALQALAMPTIRNSPFHHQHFNRRAQSASFSDSKTTVVSPYYVYFGNPATLTMSKAYDQQQLSAATIGFGTARPGTCDFTDDLDSLLGDAKNFVQKGGMINLSFGGAIGQSSTYAHIQQACQNDQSLARMIQSMVEKFNTRNVEFDIEDDALIEDTAAAKRLARAIMIVKKTYPDLHVTYTLATAPDGLPAGQLNQVKAAKAAGLEIDVLALMVMDMGVSNVLDSSEKAVRAGAKQLEKVYGLASGSGMARMGVIPMIGRDDQGAMLNLADAASLASFAANNGMAYVSYWSFNRDHPPKSTKKNGDADYNTTSASFDQTKSGEFLAKILNAIKGASRSIATTTKTKTSTDKAVPTPQ